MSGRLRDKRRRKDRRLLSETLEQRQLLAGPDLVGIQPDEGSLLDEGTTLNVSPRELVFRFNDDADIDPSTLSAIRITRAGEDRVFESATATSDLGTGGEVLLEFRAREAGSLGNGIVVQFSTTARIDTSLPHVSVSDRVVTIDVNSNPLLPTRARDVITAVNGSLAASELIEVIQVSGPSRGDVGTRVADGFSLTLVGANSAQAVTDFGTNGQVRVRLVSQLPGVDGRGTVVDIERRNFGGVANPVVVVTDQTVRVQLNSTPGAETTAQEFIDAINNNPEASALILADLEQGDLGAPIGAATAPLSPLTLSGVSDVVVEPGFVGLGDSSREVLFRFAEPLPDDLYQIDILGSGPVALRNTSGENFQDGADLTRNFQINLGPKVVAVVPEPIRRDAQGRLIPQTGRVEVHFNDDDLNPVLAQTPGFYQLIFTRNTIDNTDDAVLNPVTVDYNNVTNIATLNFNRPLSRFLDGANPGQFLQGAARLRVGTSEGLPAPPTEVSLFLNPSNPVEPGDTFNTAFDLNGQWDIDTATTQSARVTSEIFNTTPFDLNLPGPDLPGTREIRPDDPSRLDRTVPLDYLRNNADVVDGISVIQYNFAPTWLGDDPTELGIREDRTYFNVISEQQKQRVREVIQLYSEYLGISFVEVEGEPTSDAFISIAVGDLYGGDERATSGDGGLAVVTRDRNGDGIDDLGVLDFQDFDESVDDQFGGEFFRGAMFVVGQLLGYGYADDLPQPVTQSTNFIFAPGSDNEPAFPSVADIVHGQFLFRPDSTDVDLYKFDLPTSGSLSVETVAERLVDPSLLDTTLRLYRKVGERPVKDAAGTVIGSEDVFEEIAQNDDYFSNDSSIDLNVDSGTYVVGVSARGNSNYDPNIAASGFGGLSEGDYDLLFNFRPSNANAITDTSGVPLDGDGDNRPGGVFDYWFVPNDSNTTLYVDKAASGGTGGLGTISNPYTEIDQAIAASRPGNAIRVVGNGGIDGLLETAEDNFSYQIGFASNGLPLQDGSSLTLPQGVRMIIEGGAILKLSGTRIGVGSVAPLIDVSDSSLQILGTPTIVTPTGLPARDNTNALIPGTVVLTSINDDSVGSGNITAVTPAARPGDWGGIDFRGDLDAADESRLNRENEGAFLNHLQYADLRFGGGAVSIGGVQTVVSPVDMAVTRPTIINSWISHSADAAMAATPDTFAETRFTDPMFQAGSAFTPSFTRVGPDISGIKLEGNSINGLFVRVATRTGSVLETITQTARFDDTDIPHVLTENLVIEGSPGGPIVQSSAPSSLLVQSSPTATGDVPEGTYVYRITNVGVTGLESAASQPTVPVTLSSTGGIQLNQLPTVGAGAEFASRRLYRATVDPATGSPGEFRLVAQLNASDTSFIDTKASGTSVLADSDTILRSRLDASLKIDPGTVVKVDGARIEARFGANFIAEGQRGLPIVFTSLEDQRYGGSGTFDTNDRGNAGQLNPGDWGGIYIGQGATASIDQAVVAGAGGTTRIEGGFASFNPIEVHQARLRLANTRFDQNADGRGQSSDDRVGRADNAAGTVFVRAAAPVIVDNVFTAGASAPITVDVNSLSSTEVFDQGRATGVIDRTDVVGNTGPLVQDNVLENNDVNGMRIRGGELATAGVWDDVDIVHVVNESIEVPNQHIFGGLRLQSDARGSLVVKFESEENETAGIVVGGSLLTGADQLRDIAGRIGGSLQVVGHPDFPVVMTTFADDSAGAGFTLEGLPQLDTNNDGLVSDDVANQPMDGFIRLPTGPEVNNGTTIDNDVDVNTPGFFEATIVNGNQVGFGGSGVTVEDLAANQLLVNQNYIFSYNTFVTTNNGVVSLATTTITQPATLIADDVVESRGTFAGPAGTVNWTATSSFADGVPRLVSRLELDGSGAALGNIRVVSYLDEDVEGISDDILVTTGVPGEANFRAFTLDGPRRVGFSHGGFYIEDGDNLNNATYQGWAADQFNQLQTAIIAGTQAFSVPGVIDLADLPQAPDPDFGSRFGPEDITTAFAWDVANAATSATVTSFLELLAADPAVAPSLFDFSPGLWNGVVVREAADDRNVAAFAEEEPVRSGFVDVNAIPSQSQFLGEIAPDQQSGDENRRLGFIVSGSIAAGSDIDVYSFVAESETEVWLDIDRTGNQLDSVVELIDANGRVLASSNDSLLAETNDAAIFIADGVNPDAAQPLSVVAERLASQDITISEPIVDATGELTLTIAGSSDTVAVSVDAFLNDPAAAIGSALESTFSQLGPINSTLLRRTDRVTDPNDPSVITRVGDDFVIRLQFDSGTFIGKTVPAVSVDTSGVTGASVSASVAEVLLGSQVQDDYTSNPKDAGMRIRLPGEAGTRNLYHVRVRSSNTRDPLDFAKLTDPSQVRDGLSRGSYQLQIRLQEVDEHPGTQLRLADVRFATNGLHIVGQPLHSPLLGEEHETTAANDTLQDAQPLGYLGAANDQTLGEAGPLQSDRLAKSFSGTLDSATDVDWYRFEVNYENLTRDAARLYLSTVFDLDYAGGFARSDMALYVFNAAGELILVGGDSNIADDLPKSLQGNDTEDLSRGSAAPEDPYIGAAELSEGVYFVAVANQSRVPQPLDQFFDAASANPLLRLEPVDSIRRIAEDRIGSSGGGTASAPIVPLLFDNDSIVDFGLDDTLLYVNTGNELHVVNPFTGQRYLANDSLGNFGNEFIRDVAFRANGELFGYTNNGPNPGDNSSEYVRIDTANAALTTVSTGLGIQTFHLTNFDPTNLVLDTASDDGIQVEGITIREFGGIETGYLVGNRPIDRAGLQYSTNILYEFDDATGQIIGPTYDRSRFSPGAGTTPREVGQINTTSPADPFPNQLGISDATEIGPDGLLIPKLFDGDTFTLSNVTESVTFEFEQGFTLIADRTQPISDGDSVDIDGRVFEIDLDGSVTSGAFAVSVSATTGPEGLITELADVIRGQGIPVSNAGTQLALPNSDSVILDPDTGSVLTLSGARGLSSVNNVEILLLPTDKASTIAERISRAVQMSADAGDLPNVSAVPDGRSLQIVGGFFVAQASGNLKAGGLPLDGTIRGVEIVGDQLFAVSDAGGLYQVSSGELSSNGNRTVGRYVNTATDLIGINFSGLRAGSFSVESGAFSNILFGITDGGDIHAFNTRGELQPVFAGGRSMISTGIAGARGLDFSVVDFNLWHVTNNRAGDPGHGINPLFNGARSASNGGNSLAFTYENNAFGSLYPSVVERPTFAPRLDGTTFEKSYNLPGGAKGVVQSNTFSLEGVSSNDQPMLYFNYFAENDGSDDRLRFYLVTEEGVAHLLTSNSLARSGGTGNDEFDDPPQSGIYDDDLDVEIQQLFDNTNSWRQARVPLGEFAGMSNLSLRIEFSTSGSVQSNSESLRVISGKTLVQSSSRAFVVNEGSTGDSDTFVIDLAPTVSFPSGSQLAALYADPDQAAVLTIDNQDYVLDDGTRTLDVDQIAIDLLMAAPAGTTLADLSSDQIAAAVADQVQANLPANPMASGFNFSDPDDDPAVSSRRNDLLFEATPLPYSGGNLTITGAGRLGSQDDPSLPPTNLDDVDLVRLEVRAGTQIEVDVDLDLNAALNAAVRFFDGVGNELPGIIDSTTDSIRVTAPADDTLYIGISGLGNESYDPRIRGSAQVGQVDSYTARVSVNVPAVYRAEANLVEFQGGQQSISVDTRTQPTEPELQADHLFNVTQPADTTGATAVPISRFMTAEEVAVEVQRAIANRFFSGNTAAVPVRDQSIRIASLNVTDPGPFTNEGDYFGDRFAQTIVEGAADNNFEGIYIDDVIIGFAERGEIATGSNVVSTPFIVDGRPQFPNPDDPTSNLNTGSYQVEIRDASEYVSSASSTRFRTFDTNDRLTDARTIEARPADQLRDGSTFFISDGRSSVRFEFDLVESNTGVTAGSVRVPFSLQSGVAGGPQSAADVASAIVEAINRDDVQSVIDVPALLDEGVDGTSSATINLFNDVVVINDDDALASVGRTALRGDENRDRESQGVILVENSRFLFNEDFGIAISHGLTAEVDGQTTASIVRYPRNLVELNSESIAPGVVIQSNILAFNEAGGLQISGLDLGSSETASDPIPFDRIVNNTVIGGDILSRIDSAPGTFQGVLFPQGLLSFADAVVEYRPNAGGSPPTAAHQTPGNALGPPDGPGRGPEPDGQTTVSLGLGGTLTLQFSDNLLTGSGDAQPDLIVFESGAIESVQVEVSRDGVQFIDIGTIGGLTNQIDLDAVGFGTQDRFAFVRLTDLRQGGSSGASLGADIDAVGAISTVPVETFTAGGIGIEIVGSAAPVLMNNVISNSDTGIVLDPNNGLPILGGNTFYRNTADAAPGVGLGEFAQVLSDAEVVFFGAGDLVFSPAPGSNIIDSSLDSLEDRSSLTAVKNPLNLPPSPILAPRLDVNGQLRVDDPNVETPSGLGERVFKDRGAADRGDLVGPRAVLSSPLAPNLGFESGVVSVLGEAPQFFEIQLIDGLAPADVTPGTGIDDRSVSNGSVLLLKDNQALVEGVDYRFGYNPSTNTIRLTPIAGVWEQNSTYVIRLIDSTDAIVQAVDGSVVNDGDVLNLRDVVGNTTSFEYETGITLTIPSGTLAAGNADGIVVTVFDGVQSIPFELDNDGNFDNNNSVVSIPATGSDSVVAQALADAVNASTLNLTANTDGSSVQFLGSDPLSTVTASGFATVSGSIGTSIGFGLQIPADGANVSDALDDGQTFTIRRGAVSVVTFEFDTNNSLDNSSNTQVAISPFASLDDVADAIVRAVGGAGLGLSPVNVGAGRVFLGGDSNYALNLGSSALIALGVPGQGPTEPVVIGIDQTANQVAQSIAEAIDNANIAGVSASIFDTRVFVEGTAGVTGAGAVDTVTIRDEVDNLLQSNQPDGRTELIIFVGGGFDLGDAPSPYLSREIDGGPRHAVDPSFFLGSDVSADADAKLPDADDDDGVTLGTFRRGFATSITVDVTNDDGRTFFLDAWFDWNGDNRFESSEALRFDSLLDSERPLVGTGRNVISVDVPANATIGEIYARFRLSEDGNLGATGDASSGEVEDYQLFVTNNPFQNATLSNDVNNSGVVTPLDALQIINAMDRAGGNIDLGVAPLPTSLPPFPDTTGDGIVSASDALRVIIELANSSFTSGELVSEGEAGSFVQVDAGVMASATTALGDALIEDALDAQVAVEMASVENAVEKTSVFDSAPVVAIDSIVDDLAEDAAEARADDEQENDLLDQLFAAM